MSERPLHERAHQAMITAELNDIQRQMNPMPNIAQSSRAGMNWTHYAALLGAVVGGILTSSTKIGLLAGAIGGAIVFAAPVWLVMSILHYKVNRDYARGKQPAGWLRWILRGAIIGAVLGAGIGIVYDSPVILAAFRLAVAGAFFGVVLKICGIVLRKMVLAEDLSK